MVIRLRLTNRYLCRCAQVPARVCRRLWIRVCGIACVIGIAVAVLSTANSVSGGPPDSPQSGRPGSLPTAPATKRLNPYYIEIATAVITHNSADLQKYAAKMRLFADDKSRPYLWFPAMRARAFVLSRLDAQVAFVRCFTTLCHAQGNIRNQNKLLKFIPPVFDWLNKHHKSRWVVHAVAAGLPAAGPAPTKLYMCLLEMRLGEVKNPDDRIHLIKQSIGQANMAIIDAKRIPTPADAERESAGNVVPPLPLDYSPHLKQYQRALEDLRYLMVLNSFYVLKIHHLQNAAQVYLGNYGVHGPHSAEVFYRMVDALGVAYRTAITPQRKSEVLLAGGWLDTWYQKFQAVPGPWQGPIQKAWAHWQECVKLAGH